MTPSGGHLAPLWRGMGAIFMAVISVSRWAGVRIPAADGGLV